MKYLVAFDGSEWSEAALGQAISFAKARKASVVVLAVAEPMATFTHSGMIGGGQIDWQGETVPELQQDLVEHCNKVGQALLDKADAQIKEQGVTYTLRKEVGSPRMVICEVAEEEGADIIFLGSRGLGTVKRLFLGSVSDYVVHHAPCSVFVHHLPTTK